MSTGVPRAEHVIHIRYFFDVIHNTLTFLMFRRMNEEVAIIDEKQDVLQNWQVFGLEPSFRKVSCFPTRNLVHGKTSSGSTGGGHHTTVFLIAGFSNPLKSIATLPDDQ